MALRLDQIKRKQQQLRNELATLTEEIRRVESDRFVGVQFHGNSRIYTYELAPEHEAEVGDYVQVYSPWTYQNELVRVVRKGRGDWTGRTKICREIRVRVRPDESRGELAIDWSEGDDLFESADIG